MSNIHQDWKCVFCGKPMKTSKKTISGVNGTLHLIPDAGYLWLHHTCGPFAPGGEHYNKTDQFFDNWTIPKTIIKLRL